MAERSRIKTGTDEDQILLLKAILPQDLLGVKDQITTYSVQVGKASF